MEKFDTSLWINFARNTYEVWHMFLKNTIARIFLHSSLWNEILESLQDYWEEIQPSLLSKFKIAEMVLVPYMRERADLAV